MKYQNTQVVEALTFEEFVAYGLTNSDSIVDGIPWSFDYKGHPVTHENDECYLLPTIETSQLGAKMTTGDMIVTYENGDTIVMGEHRFWNNLTHFKKFGTQNMICVYTSNPKIIIKRFWMN